METSEKQNEEPTAPAVVNDPAEAAALAAKREAAMESRLIALGNALTPERLKTQFAATEKSRSELQIGMVRLGIMLEAKFLALAAAKRKADAAGAEKPPSFAAFCDATFGKGCDRTLRTYRWIAKRFLKSVTDVATPLNARNPLFIAAQGIENASEALLTVAESDGVAESIRRFIGGRTLRELLTDLAAAEKAAAREEFYEKLSAGEEPDDATDGESAAEDDGDAPLGTAPAPETEQLTFDSIFTDAEAQSEDSIGFIVARKEDVSPRVLAQSLLTVAGIFREKAKKAEKLAKQAARAAESDPELD